MLPRGHLIRPRVRPAWPLTNRVRHSSISPQPSLVGNFYKTFTRPVAKCLLTAVLTYQLVYWCWVKMETDEIRVTREREMSDLSGQIEGLRGDARKKTEAVKRDQSSR